MKRSIGKFAFFALVAMTVNASGIMMTQAHAAEESLLNELTGNTASALTFGSGQTTAFTFAIGYSRAFVPDMLQGTFYGAFSTGGGISVIQPMVGPTFNLPIDSTGIRNAIYLRAVGGLFWTNTNLTGTGTATSTSAFAYNVGLGKRFELCKVLSWSPEFSVTGMTITGTSPTYSVTPISLSFLF